MIGCRPLTRKEMKALLKVVAEKRDKALIALGFCTGFRISGLLSLKIKDIMAPNGQFLDFVTLPAKHSKNKKGLSLPLNTDAKKTLKGLINHLQKRQLKLGLDTPLFVGRESQSKPISRQRAWQILKELFAKAGIFGQTGCHTLRKTFAKLLKDSGATLEKIQKALGHKSITSTICYLSFDMEDVNRTILGIKLFDDEVLYE